MLEVEDPPTTYGPRIFVAGSFGHPPKWELPQFPRLGSPFIGPPTSPCLNIWTLRLSETARGSKLVTAVANISISNPRRTTLEAQIWRDCAEMNKTVLGIVLFGNNATIPNLKKKRSVDGIFRDVTLTSS